MPTPQRLPIVNSDDGTWGDIIRQYITKEHYNDDTDNAINGAHKTVTIRPGTATAGSAPLKFSSGTLLTTPEAGAVEFNTDSLYLTTTTGTVRKKIATYDDSSGATGDTYYRDSGGSFVRLPVGSNGKTLRVVSGTPAWVDADVTDLSSKVSISGDTMTGALTITSAATTPALDVTGAGQAFKVTQNGGSGQSVFSLARTNHATQNNEWSQSITTGGVLNNGSLTVSPSTAADISFSGAPATYDHLVLKSDKTVGIGLTNPGAKLEVSGAGSTSVSQVRLTPSTSVDGAQLLYFNIDRAWGFAQESTGAGTSLELRAYSTDKRFRIKMNGGTYNTLSVYASSTAASNFVGIGTDPTTGRGRLQFAETTGATDGIAFGSDVNLYRSSTNVLRTDDSFTIGGSFTANNLTSYGVGSQTNKIYDISSGAGTIIPFSPAPKYIWHDNLRFSRWTGLPTFEQFEVSSGTWIAGTLNRALFSGYENQTILVADGTTHTGGRWTWNSGNWQYGYNRWWLIGFPYTGAVAANKSILLESSADGVNWTTRFTTTGAVNNGNPALFQMNDNAADRHIRLTITVSNSLPIRIAAIKALSARQGNQGGGFEYENPFGWDNEGIRLTVGTTGAPRTSGVMNLGGTNPTTAAEGLWFGTDVNLYRASVNILSTDDAFRSNEYILAYHNTTSQVTMGRTAVSVAGPGITFGSAQDTNIYRSAADVLKTDDAFDAASLSTSGNITVTGTVDGRDVAADGAKLDTIATNADVTSTANVTSAGALMDSELTDLAGVKALNTSTLATLDGTQTLTNKRVTVRTGTTTSSATPTINTDSVDAYHLTAQEVDITSFTTNLSGTPTDFQKLIISITGTAARAITWGSSFENGPVALPTTTTTTQRLDVGFIWNAVTSKWRCMASGSA